MKKIVPTYKKLLRDSLAMALASAISLGFLVNSDTLLRDYPILRGTVFVAFAIVVGVWWLRMPSIKEVLTKMNAGNNESAGPDAQQRRDTLTDPQCAPEGTTNVPPQWRPPYTPLFATLMSVVGVILIGYGLHGLFMWPTTGYVTVPALASAAAGVTLLDFGIRGWSTRE